MSIMRAAAWMLFGRWAFYIVTLVSFSIIVRYISAESYGIYVLAGTFLIFSDVFFNDSVESAVVRQQGDLDAVSNTAFWIVLAFSLFIALVVVFIAYPMAMLYGMDELIVLLAGVSLVVVIQGCASVPRALLLKLGAARNYSFYSGASNLVGAVFGILAAINGFEYWSLVIQQGVLQGCMLLTCSVVARFFPKFRFDKDIGREIFGFVRTSFFSCVLNVVTNRLDVIFIGLSFGVAQVGVYGLAKRLIQIVQELVGSSFDKALVSFKSRAGSEKSGRAYQQSVMAQCILLFPAFAGFAATADLLIPLLFGRQWGDAPFLIGLLAVGGVFRSMVTIERAELVVQGRAGTILKVRFWELLIGLAAVVPFAQLGAVWMAIGFSIRYILGYFLVLNSRFTSFSEFYEHLKQTVSWVIHPFFAVSLMLIALFGINEFAVFSDFSPFVNLIADISIGTVVYGAVLFSVRSRVLSLFRGNQ